MAHDRPRGPLGRLGIAGACATLLTACVNMSGLDASSDFQCKAPEGIPCQSVSGVYANDVAGTLPALRPSHESPVPPGPARVAAHAPGLRDADGVAPDLGALRSEPTIIRIWIAPWEDADGDLNEESRVYLQIDNGRWLIEHNRERIRQAFAPLVPPAVATAPASAPAPAATPALSRASAASWSLPARAAAQTPSGIPAGRQPLVVAPAATASPGAQR
jgi:conjugal transfer pilus assembly protein TraV